MILGGSGRPFGDSGGTGASSGWITGARHDGGGSAAPTLASISPSSGTLFDGATTLTCTGTGFTNSSVIKVGSTSMTTTFVSSTSITCSLPAAGLAGSYFEATGTQSITVATGAQTTGAQTFTVNNYPNLVWWMRPDAANITKNGNNVSQWNDMSGTGDSNKVLANATANQQPQYDTTNGSYNNKPTVTFGNQSGSRLVTGTWTTPLSQPDTIYAVGHVGSGTNVYRDMLDGIDSSHRQELYGSGGAGINGNIHQYAGSDYGSTTDWRVAPHVVCSVLNGASSNLYIDAITTATASGNANTQGMLGVSVQTTYQNSTGTGQGCVAELIIVTGSENSTQRGKIMNYLSNRYAIVVNP